MVTYRGTIAANNIEKNSNTISTNNKNRNITSINLSDHIKSLWTDIPKWLNLLRSDKPTNILTSRAAIAAKTTSQSLKITLILTTTIEKLQTLTYLNS